MIVVDTSVWIEFFNAVHSSEDCHLQDLILEDRSLGLTDLIFCEILQGIGEEALVTRTRKLLLEFPILHMGNLATFDQGAHIYRTCRKRGFTIRKTIDCLIAAVCLRHDVELFHKDADFTRIARVFPLRIHSVST